jgi:hypothetical protein
MINLGISNACLLITLNLVVVHDFAISYLFRGIRAFSGGLRRGLSLLSVQNAPH